jgi:hypothetical protein
MEKPTEPTGVSAIPVIIHASGKTPAFAQAVIGPVQGGIDDSTRITLSGRNITHLLVERSNGQLLVLRLLDQASRHLDLTAFMARLENILPRYLDDKSDRQEIEARIERDMKFKVLIAETAIASNNRNALGAAIPVLATLFHRQTAKPRMALKVNAEPVSVEHLQDQLLSQLEVAIHVFMRGLDQRICSAITLSGAELNTALYNAYRRCTKNRLQFRLQAAEAFPLIGGILAEGSGHTSLRCTVDRRLPLVPALAKSLGVSAEAARWLRGKDITTVGLTWTGRLAELASYLAELCPEHRPDSPQDWEAFNTFLLAVLPQDESTPWRKQPTLPHPQLKWLLELGRIGWHNARERIQGLGATFADLADIPDLVAEIHEVLADDVGGDTLLGEHMFCQPASQVEDLFYSTGVFRQLRASLKWHLAFHQPAPTMPAVLPAMLPSALPPVSVESWPAAFGGTLEFQNLSAVCLTNPRQLAIEGKHLEHCVGNYANRCLYFGSTIVAFRDHTGGAVSTAELMLADDDLIFKVKQHKGLRNSTPPDEAAAALKEIVASLNAADYLAQRKMLQQARKERRALRRTRPSAHADPDRLRKLQEALELHICYEEFRLDAILKYGEMPG